MSRAGRCRVVIAVIPARGGSKRLPRKNIVDFFGHPMLAYTVAAARSSGLFDRVVVSTDDAEIAGVVRGLGAEVLDRPAELGADHVGVADVSRHALTALGARDGAFCQLMPNCPLRRGADVAEQHAAFAASGAAVQISVVPYRAVHPEWALVRGEDGRGAWVAPAALGRASAEALCPTGAVWWARVADFLARDGFYDGPFAVQPMDPNRGVDIDHPADLELAELLVRGLRDRDGADPLEPVRWP
jgi:CMP-N-acetylneuraminic acid synthetase